MSKRRADIDPADGRDETVDERMDRNWNEMLQELRVTQTGTQVLTGFLLAIAFQPAFGDLDVFQRGVYLALVLVAVLTTALGLAPVILHRVLFRRHAKTEVVGVGHVILIAMLAGVALVLIGAVLLVTDVVVGRDPAVLAAAAMAILMTAGVGMALLIRQRAEQREEGTHGEGAEVARTERQRRQDLRGPAGPGRLEGEGSAHRERERGAGQVGSRA